MSAKPLWAGSPRGPLFGPCPHANQSVRRQRLKIESVARLGRIDHDSCPLSHLLVEQEECQGVLDRSLNRPLEGSCAKDRVVPLAREVPLRRGGHVEHDALLGHQFHDSIELQIDDLGELFHTERTEYDNVVHSVQELGPEVLLQLTADRALDVTPVGVARELQNVLASDVGCHDDHDIAEVYGPALRVGQPSVVEHLQ